MTEEIATVPFSIRPLGATVELALEQLAGRTPSVFVFANPYSLELARRDPAVMTAIRHADVICPDGVGIVWVSRLRRGRIRERVCGPDFFLEFCRALNARRPGTRMFLLGGDDTLLVEFRRRLGADFPGLVVAGALAPPYRPSFSPAEDQQMIDAINGSGAEVLWIGLGAPKQELWAERCRDRLRVPVIAPIGGVFDFYTGRVRLPPVWMQRAGLQWLHRLAQQPRRLWRRNVYSLGFVLRHALLPGGRAAGSRPA